MHMIHMDAALAELRLLGKNTRHSQVGDVAVYFDSKLRKLKLQTYQSISPAKVREKSPDNAENRENGMWGEGKILSLAEKAVQTRRWTTCSNIYVPEDRNSRNQVLGLVTSQAT